MDIGSAGVHSLDVVMRENGTQIDQIMISDDMDFDPNDLGGDFTGAEKGSGLTVGEKNALQDALDNPLTEVEVAAESTGYGERLADMAGQLTRIQETIDEGTDEAGQEAYTRLNNLLGQIDETKASDEDYDAIQELKAEVTSLQAAFEPHYQSDGLSRDEKIAARAEVARGLDQVSSMLDQRARLSDRAIKVARRRPIKTAAKPEEVAKQVGKAEGAFDRQKLLKANLTLNLLNAQPKVFGGAEGFQLSTSPQGMGDQLVKSQVNFLNLGKGVKNILGA